MSVTINEFPSNFHCHPISVLAHGSNLPYIPPLINRDTPLEAPPCPLPASCHPRCCGQPWLIRCWARICCGSWMHPPVQTLCPVHRDSYQAVGFMILECGELEMHDLSYMVRCYDQVGGFWETPTVLPFVFSYLFMFLEMWACVKVMKLE